MKEEIVASLIKDYGSKKQQCTHPAINDDICAICKKKCKIDPKEHVNFRYIGKKFFLSKDAIRCLQNLDFQNNRKKKLHLVLDLDNTLIHGAKNNLKKKYKNKDLYEILKGETLVKLRPGARNFLNEVSQLFDLTIYTMADEPYAKDIAKVLETDKVHFSSVISRDDCTKMYTKCLDIVLSHQRVVLVVDDLDLVWASEDRGNVIKIKPYTFFPDEKNEGDEDLARVLSVLKAIHTKFFDKKQATKDVRLLLANYDG